MVTAGFAECAVVHSLALGAVVVTITFICPTWVGGGAACANSNRRGLPLRWWEGHRLRPGSAVAVDHHHHHIYTYDFNFLEIAHTIFFASIRKYIISALELN